MREVESVIIGGGPGGIKAAIEAAKQGVQITLIDENPHLGGQVFRQFDQGFNVIDSKNVARDYEKGQKLLQEFEKHKNRIEYISKATLWGIFREDGIEIAFQKNDKSFSLKCKKLIVATGAFDRSVPFPGWTLPGVFTAGGAQRLVKLQRVLPGEKILLAGTGPLQLVLADQIIRAGGKIEAILEAGNVTNWLRFAFSLWAQWDQLRDGLHYLKSIHRAGVPLLRNHIIIEAKGNGKAEKAVIAEVDKFWRPKTDTYRTLDVDTICLGYGLVPSSELTQVVGCKHIYDLNMGGWIPIRKENMETSVPGIYAVGDGSGIAGSQVAIEEGFITGVSVANSLGYVSNVDAKKLIRPAEVRLKKLKRFRKIFDENV